MTGSTGILAEWEQYKISFHPSQRCILVIAETYIIYIVIIILLFLADIFKISTELCDIG